MARPATDVQPVVQRNALGDENPSVPSHIRVSLAGRTYSTRHTRRGRSRSTEDAACLCRLCREVHGSTCSPRSEERDRTFCRSTRHLHYRGNDARRKGSAERYEPLPRTELCKSIRRNLSQQGQQAGIRMGNIMGRINTTHRSAHHDPLRRQRTCPSAYARTNPGSYRSYHQG